MVKVISYKHPFKKLYFLQMLDDIFKLYFVRCNLSFCRFFFLFCSIWYFIRTWKYISIFPSSRGCRDFFFIGNIFDMSLEIIMHPSNKDKRTFLFGLKHVFYCFGNHGTVGLKNQKNWSTLKSMCF